MTSASVSAWVVELFVPTLTTSLVDAKSSLSLLHVLNVVDLHVVDSVSDDWLVGNLLSWLSLDELLLRSRLSSFKHGILSHLFFSGLLHSFELLSLELLLSLFGSHGDALFRCAERVVL